VAPKTRVVTAVGVTGGAVRMHDRTIVTGEPARGRARLIGQMLTVRACGAVFLRLVLLLLAVAVGPAGPRPKRERPMLMPTPAGYRVDHSKYPTSCHHRCQHRHRRRRRLNLPPTQRCPSSCSGSSFSTSICLRSSKCSSAASFSPSNSARGHMERSHGVCAKAASSVVKPSPNVLTDGGGVQHRLGQVSDRSACNIKACRNPNAVLGCQTCGIHLCSPECYNAHALNGAVQGGKACAVFMEVSKLSQRLSNPNKGRHKD
jgi:hypothetical protein